MIITKKNGFTLAEALIVIIVMGLIAVSIIGNLKNHGVQQKAMMTAGEKVITELERVTAKVLYYDTVDGNLSKIKYNNKEVSPSTDTQDTIIKENSNALGETYKKYLKATNKNTSFGNGNNNYSFRLKNDASIGFTYSIPIKEVEIHFPNQENSTKLTDIIGYILVDINSEKGPNLWGVDVFELPLKPQGIIY